MPRRAETYISDTAKKLQDPEYANSYLKAAVMNHDESFKVALAGMIDKFGHAELAERIDMLPNNLTRLVKRLLNEEPIKDETIERLLAGFGLTLQMDAVIADKKPA